MPKTSKFNVEHSLALESLILDAFKEFSRLGVLSVDKTIKLQSEGIDVDHLMDEMLYHLPCNQTIH